MSVWKDIRCDVNGPLCYDITNNNVQGFEPLAALRAEARRIGWTRKGDDDICPACRGKAQP